MSYVTLTELLCTLLSNAEHYWATLSPTALRCTLLSYAIPVWTMVFSTELRSTMWATLQPNWATFSTHSFVQFCWIIPERRTVLYRNKCTPVRYRNALVPDWDAGCRNTDAGGIGLDADAQLWWTHIFKVNIWWLLAKLCLKYIKKLCWNNWNFLSLVICIWHSGFRLNPVPVQYVWSQISPELLSYVVYL